MRIPTKRLQQKGHSNQDVCWAIRLIAKDKNVSYSDMAQLCKMGESSFRNSLYQVGGSNFIPRDLTRIATELGKKCGYKEKGFITLGAMVHYAQAHYELPAGERWVKTDCRSQKEEEKLEIQIPKLPLYKRAALLLVLATKKSLTTLVEDVPNGVMLMSYLNNRGQTLSDEIKIEKMKLLASNIGRELGDKKMDLEGMLAEAKKRFPGEFPDKEIGVRGGKSQG